MALLGLLALVIGLFMGCGSFFSWNGRHTVELRSFAPGTPLHETLRTARGRRYTAVVQVVFERDERQESANGAVSVAAKMPLAAKVLGERGVTLCETTGWLDPEEAPTMLFGAHPAPRDGEQELRAERVVGTFVAGTSDSVDVRVDLGADRVGTARIREARLVVYDDALPPAIRRAFGAAVAGGVAFLAGIGLLIAGFFRGRARRGGIRRR